MPKKLPANVKLLDAIQLPDSGEEGTSPPREFRIFRAGPNQSRKGQYVFSEASAESVTKTSAEYGNELSIDYGHGMFALFSTDPALAGRAAGWFRPAVRDGELWATGVTWTKSAVKMLADREYRYISPAFEHDKDGVISRLLNVALTNIPALHELEPLMASVAPPPAALTETPAMPKFLLTLLGLTDTATDADVMAALQRLQLPMTELLSLTAKPSAQEALAVVKAWKLAADGVPAMHAELSSLKEAQSKAERQALIDDGVRRGVVPPAYKPVLETMDVAQLKAFLSVAVPVMPRPAGESKDISVLTVTLSQAEKEVAALAGVSEKDFAARKLARGGVVPLDGSLGGTPS